VLSRSRVRGVLLFVLGAVAVLAPLSSSVWGVAIVGVAIFLSGVVELIDAWVSGGRNLHFSSGAFSVLAGALISFQTAFVFSGLLMLTSAVLLADGAVNVTRSLRGHGTGSRLWDVVNGGANILLAAIVWLLRDTLGPTGFGVILGFRMAASGWQAIFAPVPPNADEFDRLEDEHPNRSLGLGPHPVIGFIHRQAIADAGQRSPSDLYWSVIFVVVFFAIHVGRLDAEWTMLGMLSPAVATLGDVVVSLVLSITVIYPLDLALQRVTRPAERLVWRRMLHDTSPHEAQRWSERGLRFWAERRLHRNVARDLENNTLHGAVGQAIRAGLPLTAVLIAINPMWGFSWYFNSENWASAVWQKVAESRTDSWRESMIDAAVARQGAVDPGQPGLFEMRPPGMPADGDFSFVVIGDPGEGDPSQHALRDQVLLTARQPSVKFVVIASDVVYPTGAMKDYEANFYLPLKGVAKPIYAIPGNHDWFNALDGFAANLMDPASARDAMEARVQSDLSLSSTTGQRIDALITQGARLRALYGVSAGHQSAPFFELHHGGFSLLAVDTGALRRIDDKQLLWLRAALGRSRGNFTMAIVGHPFYAAGTYVGEADESFRAVHDLLREHGVQVVMAGDTHDFEFYREPGEQGAMHFVNGGGGAYLSIGTALDWPARPAVRDYAFYPRTDAVTAKLSQETPWWKWPAWWWATRFGAWPFSVETLSAVFDFNRAPFYQSFMEIRVERSEQRVTFALHGVDGPLRWRDIQVGGATQPDGRGDDDPVEFVMPWPAANR
jgi:uncharacterized membrane protein HdeD (DUF308 family)/predicted phosphodiesterase